VAAGSFARWGDPSVRSRPGVLIALAVALAWSVALLIAAVTVPVYSGTGTAGGSGSSAVVITHTSATLVGENGFAVLAVIAVPLLIVLAVGYLLWRRASDPAGGAGALAWTLTALLAAGNLLAMVTVGIFVLPVTVALVVACALSRPRPGSAGASPAPPA
jgi:hypothetical protein